MKKGAGKFRNKVALDIGSHSIKMLEVSGTAEKPSLVLFGIRKIQGQGTEAISEAIKALSGELKISVKDFNISLSGPSIVARVISMPDMTSEELKSAIRFETEKSIPFDINDCMFDFYIQGKDPREKNNLIILLAAAKKDPVTAKIRSVEAAGFGVNMIDVDSFAITNAFLRNFASIEPMKTIAIINIGETYTNLVIITGGMISFVRDLSHGVNDFRTLVSKKCGIKIELSDGMKAIPADKTEEVSGCAKIAIAGLIDDIKLSFGYHENQSGRGVDQIYLSGGGAGMIGLEAAFNEAFTIKPERWSPFQYLDIDPAKVNVDEIAKINGSFVVCAGLTLRESP